MHPDTDLKRRVFAVLDPASKRHGPRGEARPIYTLGQVMRRLGQNPDNRLTRKATKEALAGLAEARLVQSVVIPETPRGYPDQPCKIGWQVSKRVADARAFGRLRRLGASQNVNAPRVGLATEGNDE